ncbi:hypothetical protein B0H15DRAFT_193679 [Mycena belliarum]|uniref:Uncharacterized protein n=1 Tax=Mycena belliarum TaxID=1033014 RepID=A0AAD6UJ10_9AGAR|nr:hypothetical protein B0H15DRAFT_193679 [Mycena belliae]
MSMSVATHNHICPPAPSHPAMRPLDLADAPTKPAVRSLVISPDLDALLEHDDRTRRAAHGMGMGSVSSWVSVSTDLPDTRVGLPPPPRRARVPVSPLSPPPPPRSPLVTPQPLAERVGTPDSAVSNPYINPAPLFVDCDEAAPISPPPRISSMRVDSTGALGRARARGSSESSLVVGNAVVANPITKSHDASPTSSTRSSPADPRFHLSSLPALFKRPNDQPGPVSRKRSTSRAKLVKSPVRDREREPSSPRQSPPQSQSQSQSSSTSTSTATSTMSAASLSRSRRRSSISISISSSDHESFIDLGDFDHEQQHPSSPFRAASPSPSDFPPRQPKPPVPSTPKPDFHRRASRRGPSSTSTSTSASTFALAAAAAAAPPPVLPARAGPPDTTTMPPTTNFLNPAERAQLVKKSRKLAQVFGQTPGAADFRPDYPPFLELGTPAGTAGSGRSRHRAAASTAGVLGLGGGAGGQRPLPPWAVPEKTIRMTVHGRRHSTPSTPVSEEGPGPGFRDEEDGAGPGSPRSFMDFSNEDPDLAPDDSVSVTDTESVVRAPPARPGLGSRSGSGFEFGSGLRPAPSLLDTDHEHDDTDTLSLSPEEQAEDDRRRKRDKLAKLHRFLGSRVPTSLVLGPEYLDPPAVTVALDGTLAPAMAAGDSTGRAETDTERGAAWVKARRRRSLGAVLGAQGQAQDAGAGGWSDELDRVREELSEREKAVIVRRAQKMEKVFGVAPPQKLYSAHHQGASGTTSPGSPAGTGTPSPSASSPSTIGRNPNQAAYKVRSAARPGTGDSAQRLLPGAEPSAGAGAGSFVYTHYQHSLNSLHDIIDRNDKESLAELHQYLNDPHAPADAQPPPSPSHAHAHARPTAKEKAERRRSLPARTSLASLASIASASSLASLGSITSGGAHTPLARTPEAEQSEFQLRRRRAAKLTQFFGVDYRDLIEDVLDSIEHGLNAERRRGTLGPDEAEELLQRLRTLKTRRS